MPITRLPKQHPIPLSPSARQALFSEMTTWLDLIQKELADVEVVIKQSRMTADNTWKLLQATALVESFRQRH